MASLQVFHCRLVAPNDQEFHLDEWTAECFLKVL